MRRFSELADRLEAEISRQTRKNYRTRERLAEQLSSATQTIYAEAMELYRLGHLHSVPGFEAGHHGVCEIRRELVADPQHRHQFPAPEVAEGRWGGDPATQFEQGVAMLRMLAGFQDAARKAGLWPIEATKANESPSGKVTNSRGKPLTEEETVLRTNAVITYISKKVKEGFSPKDHCLTLRAIDTTPSKII